MAVGPSLRQLHAHKSIHDGGWSGAQARTNELMLTLNKGNQELANAVADDLLDYWKTRIISHAEAEEDGFYQEVAERNPALQETVVQLARDHHLLKRIIAEIEEAREREGLTEGVMHRLQALLIINEIHSRDEERLLF